MAYLYETHLHTCRSSGCASARGQDYIAYYQDAGYSGIAVTDHFFRGNCTVDRHLPWREWVKEFCRGYEETREEGARRGLDVFFGWEETFEGDDYLVYGLSREWLLEHPEVRSWTRAEQYRAVKAAGGCVVHAHPFRQHSYIQEICLAPYLIDVVEAANAGNGESSYDVLALYYAAKFGLPVSAGSDIHHLVQAKAGDLYGVYLAEKPENSSSFAAMIRNGGMRRDIADLKTEAGRLESRGDEAVRLLVKILDRDEETVSRDFWDFLKRG
ncbi:MAG: PHP domain-containing protein [Treponema sp.]|jgi:hypothetical protein|nr:PHP domain-containing protein [Treponema sp.]